MTAACTYRVGTVMPQTRFWTLSVLDGEDRPIDTGMKRSGYTSAEILRDADGSFAVTLSRTLQPGNWIQLPPAGDFRIALRLYDMPGIGGALKLGAESLPAIERQECGP